MQVEVENNASELPADLTGRFRIVEQFGAGQTGQLHVAEEVSSGRRGILKLLHKKLVSSAAERQRLKRELVKQTTLTNPYLSLPVVTGESGGQLWLFRELVQGSSLRARLDQDGALPVSEAIAIGAQMAVALDELHRAGLLHRDLKPGHVLLVPDPLGVPGVVLIDAGVAARIPSESVFDIFGTPAYVSPEQAKGKLVSFRSDLYALGCVLYEMVVGRPPFEGDQDAAAVLMAHADLDPPELPASLPDGLRGLVESLLKKDPRERPFSAQQVRRTLEPFLPDAIRQRVATGHPPPTAKATLLGMAAASPPKPPKPPSSSQQPLLADEDDAPRKPPPPPGKKPPPPPGSMSRPPAPPPPRASAEPPPAPAEKPHAREPTQKLDAVDMEEVAAPVIAPVGSAPPPPPPGALATSSTPSPEAAVTPSPEAAATPSPEAGADVAALDYDDDAETIMRPALSDEEESEESAPATLPDPAAFAPTIEQPVSAPDAAMGGFGHSHAPSMPGVAPVSADQAAAMMPSQPEMAYAAAPAAQPAYAAEPVAEKKKSGCSVVVLLLLVLVVIGPIIGGAVVFGLLTATSDDLPLPPIATREVEPPPPIPAVVPPPILVPPPVSPTTAPEPAPEPEPGVVEAAAEPEPVEAEPDPVAAEAEAEAAREREEREREREAAAEPEARETPEERAERREREREERERAERPTGEAPASGGSSFEALREQARDHFRAGRHAQAAAVYERLTAMNPGHAGSFAGLGASRLAMGNSRGAVAAYQRAIQLNPSSSGFYAALGRAYLTSGDQGRAAQAYQRALALNPNNAAARQALQQLGQ